MGLVCFFDYDSKNKVGDSKLDANQRKDEHKCEQLLFLNERNRALTPRITRHQCLEKQKNAVPNRSKCFQAEVVLMNKINVHWIQKFNAKYRKHDEEN
mmetsp:Transcript_104225/g.196171  ORF Transcript_104225/g.196171 Transcript_104225/m.196171 type:complete len:98 (+) Transcript_104225:276-569(+)